MEKKIIETSIIEGANIFEKIFGYRSQSFIAPLYCWNRELEHTMQSYGISYLQGSNFQKLYDFQKNRFFKIKNNNLKSINNSQIYLYRNCNFEPTIYGREKSLHKAVNDIKIAFAYNTPAVFSTHRLNFIGNLDEKNRTENLKILTDLLMFILRKWPDVEFMDSAELYSKALQLSSLALAIFAFLNRKTWGSRQAPLVALFSFTLLFYSFFNMLSGLPSFGRYLSVGALLMFGFAFLLFQSDCHFRGKRNLIFVLVPLILFYDIVAVRIAFDHLGLYSIFGNPLSALFGPGEMALIDFIKW